jgi:hypothetical protein
VAISSGAAAAFDAAAAEKHYAEVFGRDSKITEWITGQIEEARERGDYSAQASLESGGAPVAVKLDSLRRNGELYGYSLQVAPGVAIAGPGLEEGDAVIYRAQWHEIKNQVGALKLYATFLTRKMPDGDDRQTVEKMLNGINTLIDYLAQIRRGEVK